MANVKQPHCSETPEKFGIEDCEALLHFPYHDYAADVKGEIHSESEAFIPDLGSFGNLVLNSNSSNSLTKLVPKTEPLEYDGCSSHEECLALNQSLQKKILDGLARLQTALEKNIAKQDELIEVSKESERNLNDEKVRHSKPISLFAAPYFRDVRGMVPPDNEDTIEKFKRNDVTAYLIPPKPWKRTEKDRLIEGVAANALSVVVKPYKTKRDYMKSKLKDKNLLDFEMDILKKEILEIEKKIRIESKRPLADLLEETNGKLDWMTISATNLQGSKSEEECEIMWNNYLGYSVNKEPFTAQEDNRLEKLVRTHKARDWDTIAKMLGTKRTPIQCLERYQTALNLDLTKRYWTPDEDARLIQVIDSLKVGTYIPWNKVCWYMDGRTRHQIINRYDRTICKEIKRTPFSTAEDAMLLACVKKFGLHWTKMKELLPGRSSYTIRERYVNSLDSSLKIGAWTKSEDVHLIELIDKHGYGKWAKISREMPGRTDNMCLVRARRLEIHSKRKRNRKGGRNDALAFKPMAPTKSCISQNSKLRETQSTALQMLMYGLERLRVRLGICVDMDNLDLSSFSINTLRELRKELFEADDEEGADEDWVPHYVPHQFQKHGYFNGNKELKYIGDYVSSGSEDDKESQLSNDEEDFEDTYAGMVEEDERILSRNEKLWLYEVLQSKFREEAYLIPSGMKPSAIALNVKESAECAFYRTYLRKKMFCKETLEEDDLTEEDKIYEDVLSNVIRYFVEPDFEENQPIVVCPNTATLSSLEILEVTKQRLRRTACYIDQSRPYLQYLVGYTQERPKCAKCRTQCDNASPKVLENVFKSMQSRLLIVGEDMQKAGAIETGFGSDTCKCNEMAKSREAFNLLQKRFLSLFLWPYLLSSTDLTDEQEAGINVNVANNYKISNIPPTKSISKNKDVKFKCKRSFKREDGIKENPSKRLCLETQESLTIKEEYPDPDESTQTDIKKQRSRKKSKQMLKPYADESILRRSSRNCVKNRKSVVDEDEEASS